jgi:hypothetical protein
MPEISTGHSLFQASMQQCLGAFPFAAHSAVVMRELQASTRRGGACNTVNPSVTPGRHNPFAGRYTHHIRLCPIGSAPAPFLC